MGEFMSQYKVVITDWGSADNELEQSVLRESGLDHELVRVNYSSADQLIPHVKDADALMVQFAKIDRSVIESLSRCKVISRYGVGVDMIDLKAAGERGIPVANVPDYCIDEVSTHAVAFLLMLNRHLLTHHLHVKDHKWGGVPGGPPARFSEQTVGVVGLGNIGRAVIRKVKGFEVKILGYDPFVSHENTPALPLQNAQWNDLLRRSDYITLHCPLSDDTYHLVRAEQLSIMKPTAYLINMSRGPVVDQVALYDALVNHKTPRAALDLLEKKPPPPHVPLLSPANVIITPHSSSWSANSSIQLRRQVAQNVVVALRGEKPYSIVNRKELGWKN